MPLVKPLVIDAGLVRRLGGSDRIDDRDLQGAAHPIGAAAGSVSINLANGSVQTALIGDSVTFDLPSVPTGQAEHLTLLLDNSAEHAITIAGVHWLGGAAPDLSGLCIIVLRGITGVWIADGGAFG